MIHQVEPIQKTVFTAQEQSTDSQGEADGEEHKMKGRRRRQDEEKKKKKRRQEEKSRFLSPIFHARFETKASRPYRTVP